MYLVKGASAIALERCLRGARDHVHKEPERIAMPSCLMLDGPARDVQTAREALLGQHRLPEHCLATERSARCAEIDAERWTQPSTSLLELDHAVHVAEDLRLAPEHALTVVVRGAGSSLITAALGVAVRYQRLWPRRNFASVTSTFERALTLHRALHDCGKPLVRADYEHALDVWQWVLHLRPEAGLELQIAALFHDIERLGSESVLRIEQHAPDYLAFKTAHAARGGDQTHGALATVPGLDVARVSSLVAKHEQPAHDVELRVLNDADSLSFFSLNSAGFLAYYGPEHTQKKVLYTVRRISSEAARAKLGSLRLEPIIASFMQSALAARHADHLQPEA
jgi:Domain of unknown function (DUF4202)